MSVPNIYVVDDDPAVRESLDLLLESAGHSVRTFSSSHDFLAEAASLERGCMIVDLVMPKLDGLELQRVLAERDLDFPVIVITGHGDIPTAVRAIRAGAVDFVEKPFTAEAILGSVRRALELPHRSAADRVRAAVEARLQLLSPREREVLEGMVAGHPNKIIAYNLSLSPRTVEIHRARVMDKMQARSLSELVRLALSAGIGNATGIDI